MKRTRHYRLVIGALVPIVGSFAVAQALHTSRVPAHIIINTASIASFDNREPMRTRLGVLEFRGGLALTSDDRFPRRPRGAGREAFLRRHRQRLVAARVLRLSR